MTRARDLADGTFANDLTVDTNTLYVDSTNNRVGIGTTSPARGLQVAGSHIRVDDGYGLEGSGSTDKFVINNNFLTMFTASSERVRIDSSGNVGIGTSSPESAFPLTVYGTNGGVAYKNSTSTSVLAQSSNHLYLDITRAGTAGDFIVRNGTSLTERLRLDTSGNVGIGEAAPDTMLHLKDTTANDGPVIRIEGHGQNAADQLIGGIEWKNGDGSADGPTVTGAVRHYSGNSTGSGGYTTFHTHDGSEGGEGSDAPERMRIDKSGNLLVRSEGGSGVNIDVRQGSAKAWTCHNVSGSIQNSYNISSVGDDGVGRFSININNNMQNANYTVSHSPEDSTAASNARGFYGIRNVNSGEFETDQRNDGGSEVDPDQSQDSVHGDLA